MRFFIATAGMALLLAGCMGPDGNPDGMPYAGEPDGVATVQPMPVAPVAYDPNAKAAPFEDMRAGGAGANQPSPTGNKPLPQH